MICRRFLIALSLVALCASACSGADSHTSYRYKLTLVVNNNGKLISGYNVVAVRVSFLHTLQESIDRQPKGEALVLEVGTGRLLVATLRNKDSNMPGSRGWGENAPFGVLLKAYGIEASAAAKNSKDWMAPTKENLRRLQRQSGPRPIPFSSLPDLLTFANADDPNTVQLVDPNNLAASFGRGVTLQSATIEVTDEQLTRGIEKKLPWLPEIKKNGWLLSGARFPQSESLPDLIHGLWFKQD